jgi:superfamily II DNA or RNA helicase
VPAKRGYRYIRSAQDLFEQTGLRVKDTGKFATRTEFSARTQVRVDVLKKTYRVSVAADNFTLAAQSAPIGTTLELTLEEAVSLVNAVTDRVVLDDSKGVWSALVRLATFSLTALPVQDAPGLVALRDGFSPQQLIAVSDLPEALCEADATKNIVCHEFVADMMELATAPPHADHNLRDYQQETVGAYMSSRYGLVCALPPGSGKTVVACAALAARSARGASKSLIVVPAALISQWKAQLVAFHPTSKVCVVDSRTTVEDYDNSTVIICSYETAVKHAAELTRLTFDDIVIDEAHVLRGGSKRTTVLHSLRKTASRALLLSGTPDYGSRDDVALLVSYVLGEPVFKTTPLSTSHLSSWQDRVGPLLQTKELMSLGALPELKRSVVLLEQTPSEEALYSSAAQVLDVARAALSTAVKPRDKSTSRLALAAATAQLRDTLGDACGATSSSLSGLQSEALKEPTKRRYLKELLQDGVPTVVCVSAARSAKSIATYLDQNGISAVDITSSHTPKRRQQLVSQLAITTQVLVVSAASSQGWDVPQARRVVHVDMPLSKADELQRSSRARRVSSDPGPIDVVFLAFKNSTEEAAANGFVRN